MKGWKELVLGLPGLPEGITDVNTRVTTDFFKQFEQSPIGEASYDVHVRFDKKPGLYILDVHAQGWHEAKCDRCLEHIHLPGEASYQYFFNKEKAETGNDDEDVFTLDENATELDLRPLVYESIVLSLPMVNRYDCASDEDAPCDMKVLEILQKGESGGSDTTNPMWDVLKNIDFKE